MCDLGLQINIVTPKFVKSICHIMNTREVELTFTDVDFVLKKKKLSSLEIRDYSWARPLIVIDKLKVGGCVIFKERPNDIYEITESTKEEEGESGYLLKGKIRKDLLPEGSKWKDVLIRSEEWTDLEYIIQIDENAVIGIHNIQVADWTIDLINARHDAITQELVLKHNALVDHVQKISVILNNMIKFPQ
jgi:hypothetical protein